jgi:hypothetical protein
LGRFDSFNAWQAKGWFRRIFLLAVGRGEGRFAEPTTAIRAWRPELVFMPLSSRYSDATADVSGG